MKNRFGNGLNLNYLVYFAVALVTFFAVNIPTGILNFAFRSAISPLSQDTLFPLTYSLAIFSFLVSLYWERNAGIMAVLYAMGIPFLWVIFFEILWQNSFIFFGTFTDNITSEIILFSWFFLGTVSYPMWKTDKYSITSFLVFSAGWVLWLIFGYPQMPSYLGYVFNVSLKVGAFFTIMVLAMPRKWNIRPGSKIIGT